MIKRWAKKLPYIRRLVDERNKLRLEVERLHSSIEELRIERNLANAEAARYKTWVPPGHFASPIVSVDEIRMREAQIGSSSGKTLSGIDLREEDQMELLKELTVYYNEVNFPEKKQSSHRYYFENPNYSYADAILLYSMIRHLKPRRIVEIGSGFSSCVALDTNEVHFNRSIHCTFVEPYPQLLKSLLKPGDEDEIVIVPEGAQDADPRVFLELEENDILFIDSTHVSKTNSDVNYLLFHVLPVLKSGVYVHFHDIFFPFEYPMNWIYEGRSWNECYVLRAFLYGNQQFRIELFTSFMTRFHKEFFEAQMPLWFKNSGGCIWLKKTTEPESEDRQEALCRQDNDLPRRIDLTRLTHPKQLCSGWYENEGVCRWMSQHGEVRLKGPESNLQRLWIEAKNYNRRHFQLAVQANGISLGTKTVDSIGAFQTDFALPPELAHNGPLLVALEVSDTFQAPGDNRDFGLSFGVIEIR
ncbi:MAG TPA: class I SAM-dependent methyltransferase [Terriglobia bacterium]|nr:class I SAM-dependent methyltransferase [Terriglobia bacterium]